MSYKVLYIEDEPFLARIISDALKNNGYTVNWVADGAFAMGEFTVMQPDICILDIMLPSNDGYAIAAEIRKASAYVPIIFLSAKSLTEDVIKGFKTGGNDYLKKPFSMDELLIRMESLLSRFKDRQGETEPATLYNFGECKLDTVNQILKTSTGEYHISFKETALLEMMILQQNKVLKRQTALLKLWGDDSFYNTRSMDVFMTHLRKMLKNEAGIQILNVRGIGYKMIF